MMNSVIVAFLLIGALVFNMIAQFSIKSLAGMSHLGLEHILLSLLDIRLWIGIVSYGISFMFYFSALSRGELNVIGPISQGLTLIGILIVSCIFLNETMTLSKMMGFLFVFVGMFFLFK